MKLGGNASGVGAFFMRFAECVDLWRSTCDASYDDTGRYVEATRRKITPNGLITEKKRKTVQGPEGEYSTGSLSFRISGKVYASNEDDVGAADIIYTDGSYWKVSSTSSEGCDTVGMAILLSDDECVDLGICR